MKIRNVLCCATFLGGVACFGPFAQAGVVCTDAVSGAGAGTASSTTGLACGQGAAATGPNATAIGTGAVADGSLSTAVGANTAVTGINSNAFGAGAMVDGNVSTAVGANAKVTGINSIALGSGAVVNGDVSTAVGAGASVSGTNSVALGAGSVASGTDTVSIGSAGNERTLTNVAAGDVSETSTYAVNGSQLYAVQAQVDQNTADMASLDTRVTDVEGDVAAIDTRVTTLEGDFSNLANSYSGQSQQLTTLDAAAVKYDADAGGVVDYSHMTLAGQDGTTVSNVAAGVADTDAVNVAQLQAVQTQVDQNTTDIADLDTRVSTVEGDVANVDNRVTTLEGDVSNLANSYTDQGDHITHLDAATVKYDTNADGSVNYSRMTLAGEGATTISNVAAGVAETDAVNVSQLRAAVDELGGRSVQYVAGDDGKPTNTLALTGDGTGSPVTVTNVAAGTRDTDAVNYAQIKNQVGYDTDGEGNRTNTLTLSGADGAAVRIRNLSNGVAPGDAVNVSQLNGVRRDAYDYTDGKVSELRDYADSRFNSLSGEIRSVRDEARGGIASAMAASQLRYGDKPNVISIAGGFGGFKDHTSFAAGLGWTSEDMKWRVNGSIGASLSSGDVAWGVGASYAFD